MSQGDPEWVEVLVPCSVALAEGVANELVLAVQAAKQGVQVRKGEVVFWVHPEQMQATLDEVRSCLRALCESGWEIDPKKVRAGADAPEEEWRDAWKKHFHVTRLTRQLVVVPSWEDYEAQPSDVVIRLDPGQAVGTGAHASTQLVLQEMQELVDSDSFSAPTQVFDLGTGSGILAIAAAKFWPQTLITATDVDPLSMNATRENAGDNQVLSQISASTTELSEIRAQFPLVLANMQSHILRDLRDALVPRLADGARLIVSGILTSQIQTLVDYYLEIPSLRLIRIQESASNKDWSSAQLRKLAEI